MRDTDTGAREMGTKHTRAKEYNVESGRSEETEIRCDGDVHMTYEMIVKMTSGVARVGMSRCGSW